MIPLRFRVGPLPDLSAVKRKAGRVYYGAMTPWWGDRISYHTPPSPSMQVNGRTVPGGHQLPCDPRGGVLFEGDMIPFVEAAERTPEFYGAFRLEAFAAAFHGVVQVEVNGQFKPTCLEDWGRYNALLGVLRGVAALPEWCSRVVDGR